MRQMTDEALTYYLKGVEIRENPAKFNAAGIGELLQAFENAIRVDPEASQAYAELAYTYVRFYQQGWSKDPGATLEKAEGFAKKALGLNDDFDSRWNLAIVYWNQGRFVESFQEYDAAAQHWKNKKFDPRFKEYEAFHAKGLENPDLAADRAEALIYAGEPDRAIQLINDAIAIRGQVGDPFSAVPYWCKWNFARIHYMNTHYQHAIDEVGRITGPLPNDVLLIIAASKAKLGEVVAAMTYMALFSQNDPEWSIAKANERHFHNNSDRQHWLDGLRKAGLKEH